MKTNRITGAVLGLALGDAFGAPHEGGTLERAFWSLIGNSFGKHRWTDDTQMSIDVLESLIERRSIDQGDLARRFASSYRWYRGYGAGATKLLKRIGAGQTWQQANRSVFPDGSFGNGGAMRSPVVGLYYAEETHEKVVGAARLCAEITHAHPLGIEGAILVALTTALVYKDLDTSEIIRHLLLTAETSPFRKKLEKIEAWLLHDSVKSPETVALELGNGVAALDSCVSAIYIVLTHREKSFDELLQYTIKVGGDVDTIAAMVGAIWGAGRGVDALPEQKLNKLEQCDRLKKLAISLASSN
ncbi:ADP-ribosylglycohydrolase family protein [Aliikangiella coralliicola]|uniref:ADP-ribosylglycohydrolase family protein n=1 Tax=Aliikangiella coralliicola TaxID=2592383 RepID=UPI001AEFE85C|nr:ADP-ribosylglycohydrolase family protein [Aliikangiella coralliicola]